MGSVQDTIYDLLNGGDLRSISGANTVVKLTQSQTGFDLLFDFLFDENRLIVMRTADAIEKITSQNPEYLDKHKDKWLELFQASKDIELKWHLALLVSRIKLHENELEEVFSLLKQWVLDKKESKIVRVNSLQALFEITQDNRVFQKDFDKIVDEIKKENVSSINARIKNLPSRRRSRQHI
jgi:poly(3-hydroxyalkanoate) synthetase